MPPISTEQTTQQPTTEKAIVEDPSGPQQVSSQTTVPEWVVKGPAEPGTSAMNAKPAEGNTSASRVTEQTEEQWPEVRAHTTFINAATRGKAVVITDAADAGLAPRPEEDEVEEVLGHPQDKRQHVYVSRWRNDQWVVHEEIPEVEETKKVERAAKRLVTEVQVGFAHHLISLSSQAILLSYLHTGLNEDRKVPQEMLLPDRGDHCKQQGADGGGGMLAPTT